MAASVGVAFDTTIAGLLAASAAVVISGRRKHWYGNYMTELETVMEARYSTHEISEEKYQKVLRYYYGLRRKQRITKSQSGGTDEETEAF